VAIELDDVPSGLAPGSGTRSLIERFWPAAPTMSAADRRFFTEQLALMLETGANLHEALTLIRDQSQTPAMLEVVGQLLEKVSGGRTFASALAEHPRVFSTTYVNLVAASENGGFLYQVLTELVRMEEKSDELKGTVRSALSYPIFLSVFSVSVVVFVLMAVFPKFAVMFAKIHDQLPVTTIMLMHASDFLRSYWPHTLVLIVVLIVLALRWAASQSGKETVDRVKLTVPGLKTIFMQIYLTQALRVMSLSLAHGVNITDTLIATRDVVKNGILQRFFRAVEDQVQQGNGIAAGFLEEDRIPVLVQQMISTGEQSGNLPKVMSRLADYYERELTKRLHGLAKMAEPIMLMIMGVVVGLIVSSLILPIFKLSRAVS